MMQIGVCVGALHALSAKFTILYFMWFVSHFTVGVRQLLLSSRVLICYWLLPY